jgi:ribonuclease PH
MEPTSAEKSLAAQRAGGRAEGALRPVTLTRAVMPHALGSCRVEFGATSVMCTATVEEGVPGWRKGAHAGWISAEYAMLPCATTTRSRREQNGRKGRSMEIERLVGRSLRTVCDLRALGEFTVTVDCDVLNADGGTRTAAVTGAWVALHDALDAWADAKKIERNPLIDQVAAVSVGVVAGRALVDLDYAEDSAAEIDMNLAYTGRGEFVEVQGTGERTPFGRDRLNQLLDAGEGALRELLAVQAACVGWKA